MVPEPGSARPLRVVLVEDHSMVAEALEIAFADVPDIDLVASAQSVESGLALTRAHRPDVVVLDRRLPDGDGIDALPRFREQSPHSQVLVLTGEATTNMAARVVAAGGAGLLVKTGLFTDLVAALRRVAAGSSAFEPGLLAGVLDRLASRERGEPMLTARERQVLALIAEGAATDRIAAELNLARNTVRNHIQRILGKLNAHSKLEAVAFARRNGLIE
ncbi:DNA-binding response regulator [Amycolatopsis albispora]|uniref:DNA-binding response regulator n=1 Tax=Amycolatopsis albispora TaxID=1804986 RepID=A0A344L600_9PSEU|nr:response regulator transcription factor [Amycolatopsis albispora]AXB43474.1 DNA-binding response regulator [Amycolatopsis albispora]